MELVQGVTLPSVRAVPLNGALVALRAPVAVSLGVSRRSSRSSTTGSMVIVLIVHALTGCGYSVLIRGDDTAYRRAIEHYKRTRQLVAETLSPDDDQAMFLQAEGLYRYRFARPGRSVKSYVAQTVASTIDLPVLDSLAGALDLYSLRLRSYDGAVQLWETLLALSPSTPLRPFALYRLGWAYRNSLASGLPGSSDEAFDELIAKHAGTALAQLAAEAKQVPWKSQGSATAWSIVPGLGQIYAGEVGNGTVRLAIALAATAMVVVPSVIAYERRNDLSWSRDWPLLVTGIGGAIVLTSDYSSSYQDALRAVVEHNERREAEFEDRHAAAP